jgi:glucose-1-phosphate adenylyltransferase
VYYLLTSTLLLTTVYYLPIDHSTALPLQIINKEGVKEANREDQGWVIKDGIVVVIKDSIIPSGTII